MKLEIDIPRWALPLLEPKRYKGVKGGRGSGKSHTVAELLIQRMVRDENLSVVCIREIQKSLKFSAKRVLEDKIRKFKVDHLFTVTQTEIRRNGGSGICVFIGMQDHNSDSVKSLEGFSIAWVEEAQSLSARSLKLLRPTIRASGSELIFTWNPDQPDDAVDKFFSDNHDNPDCICLHVNYDQNPFLPETLRNEMENDRIRYAQDFDHIWLGNYNTRSEARVFTNWEIDECEPGEDDILYFGIDFGFSADASCLVRTWVRDETVYIDYDKNGVGIETDHLKERLFDQVPGANKWPCRGDNSRPETISFLKRQGVNIMPCKKGKGSVEDGVDWLRGKRILVHPRCEFLQKELRLYSYKEDRAGNILPKLEDDNNHGVDALRYALEPLIRKRETEADIIDPSSTGGSFFDSAVVM